MIVLVCCNIYKKEIEEVLKEEKFSDVKALFFSAVCWNFQKTKNNLKETIKKSRKKYPDALIEILVCDTCLKSKKEVKDLNFIEEEIVKDSRKEKCYVNCFENFNHLMAGKNFIDSLIKDNAYVVTPGWILNWQAHLEEWGFDKKTSNDFFKESISKLVLLNTKVISNANEKIKEFSDYINVPFEIINTGLDYLSLKLEIIINNARNRLSNEEIHKNFINASKISADYAMAMDIIENITGISDEDDIIKKIMELFVNIFGAANTIYYKIDEEGTGTYFTNPDSLKLSAADKEQFDNFEKSYLLNKKENGFLISIKYLNEKYGVLKVSKIPFSENLNQFLSLAIVIADVCSLAISNARKFSYMEESKENYKYISFHDSLTSLYNRAFFEEELKRVDSDIERFRPVSIISADINWLKEINDTLGHEQGDQLIKGVSEILASGIRKTDILARIGGDEFIILLLKADETIAQRIIEKIRKGQLIYNENCRELKSKLKVSIALGFSVNKSGSSESIYDTLKESDKKMYSDKASIKGK